jgi:hypothetical protein
MLLTLSKGMLLQINATIIAGLLILMAVQSSRNISAQDLLLEGIVGEKENEAFTELSNDITQSFKEKNAKLDDRTADFLIVKQYENALKMKEYIKRSELYQEMPWWQKIMLSPQYPSNVLMIPFTMSSLIELIPWLKKRNEDASFAGKMTACFGFLIMSSIFITNFLTPVK